MLNNERAFDGGYYGEYIAGEKLRCYEVELRGVRMDLDEAQRLAYQLAESVLLVPLSPFFLCFWRAMAMTNIWEV